MLNEIWTVLEPTLVTIIGIVFGSLGAIAVAYVKTKRDALIVKIGKDTYNNNKDTALDVWKFVDEEFRVSGTIGKAMEDKIALFNAELLKQIPNLTQEQIDSLRQIIAGKVNEGRDVIVAPAEEKVQ